jgi:phosphatidylglycerophosphatase A
MMTSKIAEIISTCFYVGKIKYAPGTFGSIVAFPLSYLILYLINYYIKFSNLESQVKIIFWTMITMSVILFIIGTISSHIYAQNTGNNDPSEVVIDEVVGQMLTIILCFMSSIFVSQSSLVNYLSDNNINIIFLIILPFCLFRLFDILKPWPINWCDNNIKGGFGIMFDDILAAIFATIIHYIIVFIIIDYFS